jgi:ATP-dependent Clp protease ATP-binding subunit ClpA
MEDRKTKTAIVEGLANRIVANDVPLGLRDAKVLAIRKLFCVIK